MRKHKISEKLLRYLTLSPVLNIIIVIIIAIVLNCHYERGDDDERYHTKMLDTFKYKRSF